MQKPVRWSLFPVLLSQKSVTAAPPQVYSWTPFAVFLGYGADFFIVAFYI
jgi:hypothetical protein